MLNGRNFESELVFSASRSGGPGGQHVNKVSTRIELRFDINASRLLLEEEKEIVKDKLANRINKEGVFILHSANSRSQSENKEAAIEKFYKLLNRALTPVKKRKPTKPTSASNNKRLEKKQLRSIKKTLRKPSFEE